MATTTPLKSATVTRPSSSWQSPSKSRRPSQTPVPLPSANPHHPYETPIHPLLIDTDAALLARAREFAKAHMSHYDSSHDWSHIERVVALSRRIYAQLPRDERDKRGYNVTLIELAALLHDICDHKYLDKTVALVTGTPAAGPAGPSTAPSPPPHDPSPSNPEQPQQQQHHQPQQPAQAQTQPQPQTQTQPQTLTPAALLHQTLRNPPLLIPAALALPLEEIILHVSYSTEVRSPAQVRAVLARHPELEIVQDADRLDALGAIGMGRCFTYGATRRCEALRRGESTLSNSMEDSLAHLDEKLLKLEGMMKTAPGRKMARERTERLRTFKRWWQEEAGIIEYGTVNVSRS